MMLRDEFRDYVRDARAGLHCIALLSTLPVELLLALTLLVRSLFVLGTLLLSVPTVDAVMLPVFFILALAHLHALLVSRDRKLRAWCCFGHVIVWTVTMVQLMVQYWQITPGFLILALFAAWAYVRNRIPPEAPTHGK